MTAPQELGFIGLGNIGGGVCANLLADSHQVTVLDADPQRQAVAVAAGARAAGSPEEVASRADVTFLSLPGPEAMRAVTSQWLGGVTVPGKMLIDLTTNAPRVVKEVGGMVAGVGASLVEAPVTGGAPGARARRLVFIVGGDARDVALVTPLLDSLGRAVVHLGPLGSGNIGKLVNSLLAFTTTWGSLEGLALGAAYDIDLRTLIDLVRLSGAATPYVDRRVESLNERGRPVQFSIAMAAKDARLMVEAGHDAGVPLPLASVIDQLMIYAESHGLGDRDLNDLVEAAERLTSVPLHLRSAEE